MVKVNWSDAHVIDVLDRFIDRKITKHEATAEINDQQGTSIVVATMQSHACTRRRIRESRARRQAVFQVPPRVVHIAPHQQAPRLGQGITYPPTAQMDSQQINAAWESFINHWRQSMSHLQAQVNSANELIDGIDRWRAEQVALGYQGQRAIEF
ncbi:hypothetical protein L596_013961 [Steinernema carpocapsae]|uniref:Uncharacterized protein n=1 Tax=Steinernema carpocapsae TaxID=34508 RepID=A0A4U5NAR6_STECR|nr:hypothetical protein L596_013961 [Steinernema carpocapsae]